MDQIQKARGNFNSIKIRHMKTINNEYIFSYEQESKEQIIELIPHKVWWRRFLGQQELVSKEVEFRKRESIPLTLSDGFIEKADKDLWYMLKEVVSHYGKSCRFQLEKGAYPTSYIPTQSTSKKREEDKIAVDEHKQVRFSRASSAMVFNVQRDEWVNVEPNTGRMEYSESLLIEPTRTNYFLDSSNETHTKDGGKYRATISEGSNITTIKSFDRDSVFSKALSLIRSTSGASAYFDFALTNEESTQLTNNS